MGNGGNTLRSRRHFWISNFVFLICYVILSLSKDGIWDLTPYALRFTPYGFWDLGHVSSKDNRSEKEGDGEVEAGAAPFRAAGESGENAAGARFQEGILELQGDQRARAAKWFTEKGFPCH